MFSFLLTQNKVKRWEHRRQAMARNVNLAVCFLYSTSWVCNERSPEHVANFFICGRSYLAEKAGRDYMAELVRYSNEHRVVPLRTARLAAENV